MTTSQLAHAISQKLNPRKFEWLTQENSMERYKKKKS